MRDPNTLHIRLIFAYNCLHVPNALRPKNLRGDLQTVPPRRSIRRQGISVPIHHRRVFPMR